MAVNQTAVDPPKPIMFSCEVMDICCHPDRDMIACGDIDGQVTVYSYSVSESNHLLMTFNDHKKSCRAVEFNRDGSRLMTVSKDKSLRVVSMDIGTSTHSIKRAHDNPIYSLLVVDDNIVATGDDDGILKVWDLRHEKAVMEVHDNEDYISDMLVDDAKRLLLVTCGEGTLTAFDIRKHKMKIQSELIDSGLQSIARIKDGQKVVCGSEEGVLNLFNWDEWGNISDRFPGHPFSIESIVPITDSIVCTGAGDGTIRAVNILPNRILGVVGDHGDFPVESMSLSRCRRWLASCSHDQSVRFWDVSEVATETVDGHKRARRLKQPKVLSSTKAARENFFSDLASEGAEASSSGACVSDSHGYSDSDGEISEAGNGEKGVSCTGKMDSDQLQNESSNDGSDSELDVDSADGVSAAGEGGEEAPSDDDDSSEEDESCDDDKS